MTKAHPPVPGQAPLTQRQYLGAQVGLVPLWQYQKAAVIGDQLEPAKLLSRLPTDPAVACAALQRRGRKAQHPTHSPSYRATYRTV